MDQLQSSFDQTEQSIYKNIYQQEQNRKTNVKMLTTFETECPSIKNHSAIYYKERIYIFGGYNGQKNLNKLHILNLRTNVWEQPRFVNDSNELPQGRNGHTSVVVNNKMYVIGGWIGQGQHASNQLYILDLDLLKWTKMETSGQEPGPCNMHTAEHWENKIYVYRGGDGKQYFSDLHSLDIITFKWEKVEAKGSAPPPRANHASCIIGDFIYIFGGWDGQKRLNDLYKMNLRKLEWTQIERSEWIQAPPARAGMKMINVEDIIYMFGGSGPSSTCFNDLWLFDPKCNQWQQCRVTLNESEDNHNSFEGNDQSGDSINNKQFLQNIQKNNQNNLMTSNLNANNFELFKNKNNLMNNNNNGQTIESYLNPRSGHSMTLYKNLLYIIGGSWGPNYYKNYIALDIDPKPELSIKYDDQNANSGCGFFQNLKQFYNNPQFSDVQFSFQGEILYAHKVILSLMGESFNTMFTLGMKETHKNVIEIKNIEMQIFKIIVKSLYYNNLELEEEQNGDLSLLFEVLRVCDQFLIEKMIIIVQQKIKELITNENIEEVIQMSIQYNASYLIKYCLWLQRRNKYQESLQQIDNQTI
ncbi:hypothetical protein ABPG74_005784 [Tetrahymena malaccensis]